MCLRTVTRSILFYLIYYITAVAFILVTVLMVVFLVMYRDRNDGRRATYSHGNTTLEIIWTMIPPDIFIAISFMSVSSWAKIKRHAPDSDFEIQVAAKQFNWDMGYPGPDGKLATEDDIKFDNDIHVPVNKVVRIQLKASDVIHSFFLPSLRVKQDAVPGRKSSYGLKRPNPASMTALRGTLRFWPFRYEGVAPCPHSRGVCEMGGESLALNPSSRCQSRLLKQNHPIVITEDLRR